MKKAKIDKPFLFCVLTLMTVGFFIFSSASLGLLAKGGDSYTNVAFSQLFLGIFLGSMALLFFSRTNYKNWRKYGFYIFIISVIATLLVFVPGLGFEHGGAKRWLHIFGLSIQPSEFLKMGFIIYFAALLSSMKDRVGTIKYGLVPFLIVAGIVGVVVLNQPDTDTFLLIASSGLVMFMIAGGKWRHLLILVTIGAIAVGIFVNMNPYIKDRIATYINPKENSLTSGYQIQQSLIAIGSGGVSGRGFGQSIQKFNFLPEPIGDSIFAVAAEEFGFVGSVILILLFVFFAFRGLKIAVRIEDSFGRLLVVGIVILVTSQAFLNIASMLGILPLSGNPLPFVSHGGTALFITLAMSGIVLNVSRYQKGP